MIGPVRLALGGLLFLVLHPAAAQEVDAQIQDLSNRNADFAARLYRAVASRTDDNILLSPFTLSTGLAALMSGADGSTRQQILQGLGLASLDPQRVPDLFQSLKSSVTQTGTSPLRQGVAVLPSQSFQVSAAYLDLIETKYGGNSQNLAYSSPQEARDTINRWAQDQTGDQVKDLVGSLDSQTQLLLTTAVFYQSQFALAFNASFTQDERFYVDKYHIVQVPMMFRSDKYFLAYDSSLKLGVLKLPMTDGAAMLVLLPDENVDVTSIEEEITGERLQAWTRQLKKTKLEVQLPRLLLERSYSLRDVLQALDISEAFQDGADLTNISGDKGLKLTQVFHKAVVSVDESSSSAAEGGGVNILSSLPPRLTINRPFLFLIYQESSGSVLFMSRVVDPSRK
ncbi:serpin peptidase inhibitor, clade A (alpha-1 antiproteinase, antitrypsin), member 10a [Centroberyx gerrardi]|uniref:serpin peptidase inhibitor, clade A (alpha-1 antiproteinase, antitrypsin), member 10a n=1 Tax=Centroberyx gerrardi TaxID=166262 RepID=UPI003AAFA6E9